MSVVKSSSASETGTRCRPRRCTWRGTGRLLPPRGLFALELAPRGEAEGEANRREHLVQPRRQQSAEPRRAIHAPIARSRATSHRDIREGSANPQVSERRAFVCSTTDAPDCVHVDSHLDNVDKTTCHAVMLSCVP